jgi:hypothetical protein
MKYNQTKKGGVLQNPYDPRTNFFTFLRNSHVSLLSNSSNYGIIFRVDLINPEHNTPYYMFRSKNFGEPIKSLLIKICPLVTEYKRNRPMLLIGGKEKKLTIKDDFLKEYYNQVYIALDTCKYLETVCPFPIYNDAFNLPSQTDEFTEIPIINDELNNISDGSPTDYMFDNKECLNLLLEKTINTADDLSDDEDEDDVIDELFGGNNKPILQQLIDGLTQNKYDSLGIIAMEIADDFRTLKTFKNDPNYMSYQNFGRYELITLALEQQIVHCDFHSENLMINPTYEGYFEGKPGKCLLIDFGLINKIDDMKWNEIKELYNQKKYERLINIIYEISIPEPLYEYPGYTWFKQFSSEDISQLDELINLRKLSKSSLQQYSRQLRASDPETLYPKIPLSLRIYQKHLPKMAYGMLLSGGGFYGGENIDFLLKNILKTISIGINSLFNLYDKIHKNDKTNLSTFFGFKTPNIELKKSIFGFKSNAIKSNAIKSQTINSQNDLMNEKINMNQNNIYERDIQIPIFTDIGGNYRKKPSMKKTHRKRSIKKRSSRKHKYLR